SFVSPLNAVHLTNPNARASRTMAECAELAAGLKPAVAAEEEGAMEQLFEWGGGTWGGIGLAVLQILSLIVVLLVCIAFLLLFDRKVWAAVQLRKGPNVVGPFGLFQSFADLIKFVIKENVIPAGANKTVFLLAPIITLTLALI